MGKMKDSTIPDDGPDVIHDALCTWMPDIYGPEDTGLVMEFPCFCVLIDKVRKDQTERCIAAVEALPPKYSQPYLHDMQSVIATLRALLSNDSVPDPASVDIDAYISSLDATGLLELHRKIVISRGRRN
jgi:hypothetical protein